MLTQLWPIERAIRVSGGMLLFATPALNIPTYPWNLLGLVVLATGIVGVCPIYETVARLRRVATRKPPTPPNVVELPRERRLRTADR